MRIFPKKIYLVLFLLFCMILFPITSYCNNDLSNKNILFISSYAPNFTSFNDQVTALSDNLKNASLQIEYMDAKRFKGDESEENFYNLLKFKIKNYKEFDAIILSDDVALSFALKYKSSLFEDIPMVFFGVTEEDNIKKAKELNIDGGIIEYASIKDNIDFINKIYKNKSKNLILLAGNSVKYNREISEFYNLQNKYKNFNFKYLEIPAEVNDKFIKNLSDLDPAKDIVFYIYPYRDGVGKSISVEEGVNIISNNVQVPVFTTLQYDIQQSSAIIGGKNINHYEQGKLAAELVNKILNGEHIESNYIYPSKSNLWSFNYDNLNKFNIDECLLPSNSKIEFKPPSFWEKYEDFITPVFLTILGLILVILAFIIHTIKSIKHKQELQNSKKIAEDANIAKSSFISTISHELRTPVAVILSSNQLLKKLLSKESISNIDNINANFDIINQNSNRLLRLINNIIDIAKVDSGFTDLKLVTIDIVNLIEDTVLSVIPYAKSKNLEIVFDTTIEEFPMSVDAEKIERVVLNLLSNAIKFSYENSKILATISINDDFLTFSVQDFGVGINFEDLDKIFDKFIQIDNSFTRNNEGSGIGLSIVKSFIELHNGKITVESTINYGSIFKVYLPINMLDSSDIELKEIPSNLDKVDIELSDIFK